MKPLTRVSVKGKYCCSQRERRFSIVKLNCARCRRLRCATATVRLQRPLAKRCHGLAPWSFTVAATKKPQHLSEMPRPCAVEFHARGYKKSRNILERCHGLAPWSFTLNARGNIHQECEAPQNLSAAFLVAASVRLHGARPWHPNSH